MRFTVQTELFKDESLESYLLRLAVDNTYIDYSEFADVIGRWLVDHDHELEGAFPCSLDLVNLYHAKDSSIFRVRALKLFETLTSFKPSTLLSQSLLRTNYKFAQYTALKFGSSLIPRVMLRENKAPIPICPQCIKESAYIRQCWHLKPYTFCHKHNLRLLNECPKCGDEINYIRYEVIEKCICGADLSKMAAVHGDIKYQKCIKNLFNEIEGDKSSEIGKLLWFSKYKNIELDDTELLNEFYDYFEFWPATYLSELEQFELGGINKQIRPFNQTPVNDIWKEQIALSKLASPFKQNNEVLKVLSEYFVDLVYRYPKSETLNPADTLLTKLEASILLRTPLEQVNRLLNENYLHRAIKPKKHEIIEPFKPLLYLRQVIELMEVRGINQAYSNLYTTTW
ncbi:hypothetical protein D5R81_02080 [Parashewanella spongiae]|uniref:TniQ domain-containing protein n=1 Tax=Parashewanella spongiae TaxID=342950 RepID=A0A3A6U190_9GAMM|nr:TniQ family protein [Parashewanella spongiae]MCL1076914.1 TniQ family protein [Parashewanella spongiae]RJY19163.1 hypothetical protein D5R81_02080 [Parashewanella spongiae]USN27183.1 TniQ family protein [synthetic construct]